MLRNYFKIALRHISRNKGYVFINILGLGIALACTLIAFVNWQQGATADQFHEKHEQIYRILATTIGSNGLQANIETALPPMAEADIKGVKAGIRYNNEGVIVKKNEAVFNEQLTFVDANFLEVFTFPLITGNANALADPTNLLITQKAAKKYFGEEKAVGRTLMINPGQKGQREMVIGAVLQDPPPNSSLDFDFLTNIAYMESKPEPDTLSNWRTRVAAVFLELNNPSDKENVEGQLAQYIPLQNQIKNNGQRVKYILQPLKEVFMSENIHNNWIKSSVSPSFYWGPVFMALLIFLTACLNFTNTTISFSNKRLKEMGVRKVMGSGRSQLVLQLLGESFVTCVLAVFLGIILAEYLVPVYNKMWSAVNLDLSLDYFQNVGLLWFLIGVTVFATFLGGAYPAFYISAFQPSQIFRGSTKFGGDNWLVRGLLGIQIVISLIAIIGGVTFAQNAEYQKNMDLGYDIDGIINLSIDGEKHYETFKNVISQNPEIQAISGSRNNLGFGNWWSNIGKVEDNVSAQMQYVGENFVELMGLDLLAGRTFDANLETDFEESVMVNQKLAKMLQWDEPVGEKLEMWGKKFNVIGLVADFHPDAFFSKPSPGVFHFQRVGDLRYMKIKVPVSKMIATNEYLEEQWMNTFPLTPFNSFYQDEMLAQRLSISQNIAYIYSFLAIVTILLSATGLFSLVSLNVLKRAKEIAVRRVLGATPENITYTINKHYVFVFLIGGILGGLAGSWFSLFLIDQIFDVYDGVSTGAVVASVIGICFVGAITIGGKIMGVLQTNPAETLKSE